jgi:uncharacterized protein (DUF1778 family)
MASAATRNDARLNFRLSSELKREIEEAADQLGQSVTDFAVSTLVRTARIVAQEQFVTQLSNRDRDRFTALLDDADAQPNDALQAAARTYNQQMG